MQMRQLIFFTLSILFLTACQGEQQGRRWITVFAYDLCLVDLPVLELTLSNGDDSAVGTISYASGVPGKLESTVEFYVGNFPDLSGFVEQRTLSIENANILSAVLFRNGDGKFVVAVTMKDRLSERQTVLFRDTNDLSLDSSFMSFIGSMKRCRVD